MVNVKSIVKDGDSFVLEVDGQKSVFVRLSDFSSLNNLSLTRVEHWVKTAYFGNYVPRLKVGRYIYFSLNILTTIYNLVNLKKSSDEIKTTLSNLLTLSSGLTPGNFDSISDMTIKVRPEDIVEVSPQTEVTESVAIVTTLSDKVVEDLKESVEEVIHTFSSEADVLRKVKENRRDIDILNKRFSAFKDDILSKLKTITDHLKKNSASSAVVEKSSNIVNIQPDINKWRQEILLSVDSIAKELSYRDLHSQYHVSAEIISAIKDKTRRKSVPKYIIEWSASLYFNRKDWLLKNIYLICNISDISDLNAVGLLKSQTFLVNLKKEFNLSADINHFNKLSKSAKESCLKISLGSDWAKKVDEIFKQGTPKPNYSLLKLDKGR